MWNLPHPGPGVTDPTIRRFMSILASAPTAILLGAGLTMDSTFRPAISGNALLDGSLHTDTVAQAVSRGSLIYGNSTPKWDELALGAANRFLQSDGTDVAWVALSGDATLAAGVLTIANDAVTDAKLRESAAVSVIGRSAATGGNPADIAATKAGQALQQVGTTLSFAISQCLDGMFACRMQRDSTTQVSLQYFNGRYIDVNGEMVDVGASGYPMLTSDNLLSSTGTDSAGAMGASTLYYVYVSNSQASFAANDLRASATGPSAYRGAKYLGTSGNAAHWRFVGWVRTNGSTNFVNTALDRLVINYHNRLRLSVLVAPGYTDDNSLTTYTTTSTTYVAANGGTGSQGSYIANGEDAVSFRLNALASNSTPSACYAGIGENSTANAAVASQTQGVLALNFGTTWSGVPAEGYRTINVLIAVSAGTGTFYADTSRLGSAADPYATFIEGEIRG